MPKKSSQSKKNGGSSFASGHVVSLHANVANLRNYGSRICAQVQLLRTGELVEAYIPHDGGSKFIQVEDPVLLMPCNRADIPQVKYQVVKVRGVSLVSLQKQT